MVKTASLLLVFLFSLNTFHPPDKRSIRCFTKSFRIAVADDLGHYQTMPIPMDDEMLFVCGDLRMVESVTHSMEHRPPDTDTYEDRYSYLVFEKDSSMGIEYQAKWPDSTRRHSLDLVTKARRINDTFVVSLLGIQPHLVRTIEDVGSGMRTEIYTRLGTGGREVDTCKLYFSKRMQGLPSFESLSPYLDSARGARLFEVRCTIDTGFSKEKNTMIGRTEFHWKIEEKAFFNRDSIFRYFTRYQDDIRHGGGERGRWPTAGRGRSGRMTRLQWWANWHLAGVELTAGRGRSVRTIGILAGADREG